MPWLLKSHWAVWWPWQRPPIVRAQMLTPRPCVRCLPCILLNLGHVLVPPIISCLAAGRWQSPCRGVGLAAWHFRACDAGSRATKSPPLFPAAGEVAPWELEGMKCKWEEGAYFQRNIPNHSDGCKQTFLTKAFWDSGLHHLPPAGIPLPFTSRSGHLVGFERGMPIIFLVSLPAGKMTHTSSMSMCLVYLTCITHHLGRNSTCWVLSPCGHLAENTPSLSPRPQTWDLTSSQLQSWLLLESVFQRIHFPTEDCPQVHPKRDRRRHACSVSEGSFPNGIKGYLPVPVSLDSDKLLFKKIAPVTWYTVLEQEGSENSPRE